jgi:hypothetical protein
MSGREPRRRRQARFFQTGRGRAHAERAVWRIDGRIDPLLQMVSIDCGSVVLLIKGRNFPGTAQCPSD